MKKILVIVAALMTIMPINLHLIAGTRTISFQGVLTDAAGEPAAPGDYPFAFSLWTAETEGVMLWREPVTAPQTRPVTVGPNGRYQTALGEESPFDPQLIDFVDDYWLQIEVGGAVIGQRQQLYAAPYAISSHSVSGTPLENLVRKSDREIEYYISLEGDDLTGIGTREQPWRTVQHALDQLPKYLAHQVTILMDSGAYPEPFLLEGFVGAGLIVIRPDPEAEDPVIIDASEGTTHPVQVRSCNLYLVRLQDLTIQGPGPDGAILVGVHVRNSNHVNVQACRIRDFSRPGWDSSAVYCHGSSFVSVKESDISSCHCGLQAIYGAIIYSSQNFTSGETNVYNLVARMAGTVGKYSNQPDGEEFADSGGEIRE